MVATSLRIRNTAALGRCPTGVIRLRAARLSGQLDCAGATLRNDSRPALNAEQLQTDQGMFLNEGFSATGAGTTGAVCLLSARIGGQLVCTGATLRNDSCPALNAEGLRADQDVILDEEFEAIGSGNTGAVHLLNAQIGGYLNCGGATLSNDSGPALNAEQL